MNSRIFLMVIALGVAACYEPTESLANLTADPRECPATHSRVGQVGYFSDPKYGVEGKAEIVSDCAIKISSFNFNAKELEHDLDVRIYGASNGNFKTGISLSDDLNGRNYRDREMTVYLPEQNSLDDIDSLSVWCVPYAVDFGVLFLVAAD
jgi:hypothetical protein